MTEPAGWRPDPNARHEMRYWDGIQWTNNVSDQGQTGEDPYDSSVVPPPPASAPAPPRGPRSVSYRLVCYDRKGNELYSAPYQSPDMAIQFANDNTEFQLKHTLGSALMKGAIHKNIVRWRSATVYQVDDETGQSTEYHTLRQR